MRQSLARLRIGARRWLWRLGPRAEGAAVCDDQELLNQSLDRLRTTGTIEYTGEFGAEITTFIPFAYWLKTEGLLAGRRVITYDGMRPFYYFLDDDEFHEKSGSRDWLPVEQRDWPTNSTYSATKQRWHVVPDYRTEYRSQGMTFGRPVLFIQNKFTVEWEMGPINYLPLQLLEVLFSFASDRFDVVYSRPGALPTGTGYTSDHNTHCEYPDMELARRFSNVVILEALCADTGAPYNLTKLEILAKSHLFVGVQGGGAHLLACFGDSLLLLLHSRGLEYPHAYAVGPYKYLSHTPPVLLLARSFEQLAQGVAIIGSVGRREGNNLQFDRRFHPIFQALRF